MELELNLADEFIDSLKAGDLDDDLSRINDAVRERRGIVNGQKRWTIKPGDWVQINEIRPTYLKGTVLPVTKVNQKTCVVSFPHDPRFRRFSGATDVRVPLNCVEKVEPPR